MDILLPRPYSPQISVHGKLSRRVVEERTHRQLAAILAADVAGYSRLMERAEADTFARLRAHRRELFEPEIARYGGRIFKLMGDGLLAEFASVVDAVECAVTLQRAMATRNAAESDERRIAMRIGVNLGDVIVEGDDRHGDGVNIAARLEALAEPGRILLSGSVYDQVKNKLSLSFEELGNRTLKNLSEPVRVYRILAADGEKQAPPAATGELTPPSIPSIAVLPFDNLTNDAEQNYFSDGISEDIITDLSKISGLFVIARNTAFNYRGRTVNIRDMARELGIRYVLEGSVRRSGNRVRITAQLIDGSSGGHLWAERYDRDLTDIFSVQDEITQRIVAALAITLTHDESDRLARKEPEHLAAYDCYLRGSHRLWAFTRESCADARNLFETAIAIDPKLAPAYTMLSHAHLLDYVNRWREAFEDSLKRADELARKAVELDPDDATAQWQMGLILLWFRKHDLSIAAERRAITLSPSLATAHAALGRCLVFAGRPTEGLGPLHTAIRLDPYGSAIWLHFLAEAEFALRRYEDAAATLQRRIFRQPDTDVSRVLLASCYGHLGRVADARDAWREAMRINPDYSLDHRRRNLPYKDPADFEQIVTGLRLAGLPD